MRAGFVSSNALRGLRPRAHRSKSGMGPHPHRASGTGKPALRGFISFIGGFAPAPTGVNPEWGPTPARASGTEKASSCELASSRLAFQRRCPRAHRSKSGMGPHPRGASGTDARRSSAAAEGFSPSLTRTLVHR